MSRNPVGSQSKPFFRRRGVPLAITGFLVAVLFALYAFIGQDPGEGWRTPLLIGVFFGVIMLGFGIYRALKGPSALDYPRGGTNNEPE